MLAGYEALKDAFTELGASLFAATVDDQEKTAEVAADLSFPVAYGVTRAEADNIGAWWEPRRDHIQPSEFLLTGKGRVLGSAYSNLPIGRMDPKETLALLRMIASRNK
ncbi:MAG: peroxiredoxin family protein [Gammaproteobacteria bacterium]|nr:peroxiredoxin family protein [Gammaproteobacteria bacterium]MYK81605.1 peroxiredoxin family protein [Gammaproteobacteria bacterium]